MLEFSPRLTGSVVIEGDLTVSGGNSGSYSGSFQGDGSQLTGIVSSSFSTTASYAVSASHEITLETSSSFADSTISASFSDSSVSASFAQISTSSSFSDTSISSSFAQTASYAQNAEGSGFPFTGSAEISGSLIVSEEFIIPIGTTAERSSNPSIGSLRFNTTLSRAELFNGIRWAGISEIGLEQINLGTAQATATANDAVAGNILEVEYLVIAGGGGSCLGGGGGGGYRSSVTGESSGGGASAESVFEADLSTSYTVTVGAGGTGVANGSFEISGNGANSVFSTITSIGGGGGGSGGGAGSWNQGDDGGSGGGGHFQFNSGINGGSGTANQGFDGGDGNNQGGAAGGGGGAGGAGQDAGAGEDGGVGVSSSITGSSIGRAGGGGGYSSGSATDGGGSAGNNGTANTGGGGGTSLSGTNGGSGVVILRYPSNYSITIGAGLTSSTATVGANKVTTFTAGTDTISFS